MDVGELFTLNHFKNLLFSDYSHLIVVKFITVIIIIQNTHPFSLIFIT